MTKATAQKSIELNAEFRAEVSHGVRNTWNTIAYDLDDTSDVDDNAAVVLDYIGVYGCDAAPLIEQAIKEHGYQAVKRFIVNEFGPSF